MFHFVAKERLLLVFPLLIFIAGCAINDKGFIKLQYFENDTSYLRTQTSWGGYLSTRYADRGLVLGYTDRVMVYPKLKHSTNLTVEELLRQVDNSNFVEINVKDIDINEMQPFAWVEKNKGVMFHANPLKIGMTAGVESKSILRLPPGFDGVFIIKHHKGGEVKAGIQGNFTKQ